MTETSAALLEFRAAFPDETGRAAFLDPGKWETGPNYWFLAMTDGPPERMVGAVRYAITTDGLDFRMVRGPGGELAGREGAFLETFLDFCRIFEASEFRYVDSLEAENPINLLLENAGFRIAYREQRFEAEWREARDRVTRIVRALDRRKSPLDQAEVVPIRRLKVDQALPLVVSQGLMKEKELRAMWNSPDPTVIDRDISACLMLEGKVLGVILCADSGDRLRVLAIVGREDFPGARRRAVPMLMDHVFQSCEGRGYRVLIFRANVEMARQTVNLALRASGRITGEIRRFARGKN